MLAAGLLIAVGGLYLYSMMDSYQKDWARVIRTNTTKAERHASHRKARKQRRGEATHTRKARTQSRRNEVSASPKATVEIGF
jgi:hypothetical protein